MKNQGSIFPVELPSDDTISSIDAIILSAARRALQAAVEFEVDEFIERCGELRDPQGRQAVVRNGFRETREIATVAGRIPITQPRVRDRRPKEERLEFTSALLPRYARRSKSLDVLVPILYLKGVATGDMAGALESILGPSAPGLSASTVTRLVEQWQTEYKAWSERDLSGREYVYVWVDGIYTNVRLTDC
jgi:putative transposase